MANKATTRETKTALSSAVNGSAASVRIFFNATLYKPKSVEKNASWTYLKLPIEASMQLPTRSMTSVEGECNGVAFRATLEPDGNGSHWLKVDRKLREAAGAKVGDVVSLEIAPMATELEPTVPADVRKMLAAASPEVRKLWASITTIARRDWIHWIVSAKQAETRARRISTASDMLSKGKRRPCCFDRSGMYSKSLACPVPDDNV